MTPTQINGEWFVMSGAEQIAGPFRSNGDAWRWIDRQEGSPINPAERKSDWIAGKILGGAR